MKTNSSQRRRHTLPLPPVPVWQFDDGEKNCRYLICLFWSISVTGRRPPVHPQGEERRGTHWTRQILNSLDSQLILPKVVIQVYVTEVIILLHRKLGATNRMFLKSADDRNDPTSFSEHETHHAIFAVPGFDRINLGHDAASQCSRRAPAHRKLPEIISNLFPALGSHFGFEASAANSRQIAPPTWGTHECQFHWKSPWEVQISSCVRWWQPWRGSQIHRYPERTPGPSEPLPRSRASWWEKEPTLRELELK